MLRHVVLVAWVSGVGVVAAAGASDSKTVKVEKRASADAEAQEPDATGGSATGGSAAGAPD